MMNLVITEKPSVAAAVSAALGLEMKTKYGYVCKDYVVSWCVGHLVTLAQPAAYAEKYRQWNKNDLPILPDQWQYEVIKQTRTQYEPLKELLLNPQISTVICATDAGREGELIFQLVYEHCGCTKPVKRLWLSSLEPETIRKGFANLRDSREYNNLYKAALCRAQDICIMLQELVTSAKGGEKDKQMLPPEREVLDKCPGCGGETEALLQDAVSGLSPLPDYWQ